MIEVIKEVTYGNTFYLIKETEELHREDGPAAIYSDGDEEWYIKGLLHREDGPAVIYRNDGVRWWLNGNFFKTKEKWFEDLPEDKKLKMLYSEYFIGGRNA